MTRFVLLGGQRTGTTFVRDCLDSHPDVTCLNELFTMNRVADDCYATYLRQSPRRRLMHYVARRRSVRSYLDELFAETKDSAVGLKFMYSQARFIPYQFPYVLEYARQEGMKIVHLIRRNYLRTIISRETARTSRVYHATKGVTVNPINLDTARIVRQLDAMRDEEAAWSEKVAVYDHVNVYYEDFVANKAKEGDRVCEFLGVRTGVELQSRLVKLNPPDIGSVVENYDELVNVLRGTEFEPLVAER